MAAWIVSLTLAIAVLIDGGDGARVLQIAPGWSASHIMFNYRLAEMLTESGHNVTVMIMMMTENEESMLKKSPKGVESLVLPLEFDETERQHVQTLFQSLAFQKPGVLFLIKMLRNLRLSLKRTCEAMLTNHELLDRLNGARFDMMLMNVFALCPAALAHRLSIPNIAWLAPGNFFADHIFWSSGIPDLPSVMPSALSSYTDQMSFTERVLNTLFYINSRLTFLYDTYGDSELVVPAMPPYHTASDPGLWELVQRIQTMFINGEPFLDLPRQLIPGISYLGALYKKDLKTLAPNWQQLMDESDRGVILFSFGTIANTSAMPMKMKNAFFNAFQNLTDYTIVWKLEGELPEGLLEAKHIKLVNWMPQWDLLNHPKMKLFITHGGYNSMLECAQAAVPMILVPLFADQYGNAARAERLGIGKVLHKTTTDAELIYETFRSVLFEERYYKRARALASQLDDKIVSNSHATAQQIGRIVKSNRIWPTTKVPQKLSYIQYFCLDVIGLFLAIIFVTCYYAAKLFMIILRFLMNRKAQKYV